MIRGLHGPDGDDVRPDVPRRRRHGRPRLPPARVPRISPPFAGAFRWPAPSKLSRKAVRVDRVVSRRHPPGWRNWQTRGLLSPLPLTWSVGSNPTPGTSSAASGNGRADGGVTTNGGRGWRSRRAEFVQMNGEVTPPRGRGPCTPWHRRRTPTRTATGLPRRDWATARTSLRRRASWRSSTRRGLSLVGDVLGLQRVGVLEVVEHLWREPISAPEVLGEGEVRSGLGHVTRTGVRRAITSSGDSTHSLSSPLRPNRGCGRRTTRDAGCRVPSTRRRSWRTGRRWAVAPASRPRLVAR